MKFHQKIIKIGLIVTPAILITIVFGLRVAWSEGGPEWTYYLGNIIVTGLVAFSGALLFIGALIRPNLVRKFLGAKEVQRTYWILLGLFFTLFGLPFFVLDLVRLVLQCPVYTNCP